MAHAASWTVTPDLNLSAAYHSNMDWSSTSAQGGLVTSVAPALTVDGVGSHLNAHMNAQVSEVQYQGHPEWTSQQNTLASYGTLEAIDKWLYIDASANVGQRSQSSFTPASTAAAQSPLNQVTTQTELLSPYIKGSFGQAADYQLRVKGIESSANDPAYANTQITQTLGSVRSRNGDGRVGWFTDFDVTGARNAAIGNKDDSRLRAGVIYLLQPHWHLSVSTGVESTNFAALQRSDSATPGVGLDWKPAAHAQASMQWEQRYFGDAYNLQVMQQFARSAWRYTETRDVAVFPTLLVGYNPGAISSLLGQLLSASITDPVQRNTAVRDQVAQLGPAANFMPTPGSDSSRLYVNLTREGALALLGRRDTVTLMLQEQDQQLLPYAPTATDSFSLASSLRQQSATLGWMHHLTPKADLVSSLIYQNSIGQTAPFPQATQTSAGVNVVLQVAPKQRLIMGLSQTQFVSDTGNFNDTALSVSFTQRF